ncbi:RNA polymerase, sigma-24 subunit [Pedobacter cryoconitis]|uniref:RNA polymerase, sigma-24 subunit n=1 Tax=Pedobacter cryoconitis TaxID=188932 RepID=A0A127V831_9SPHI|nr:RNA polymerase sigma-70 factor [Pedobacter cryoconitis]AMP97464.1 RNA polymerase, sigma-24 subunit [Pedobacter cryoconitis]
MNDNSALPDSDLVIRLRNGEEVAFKIIFDRWFKKLYYFSFRYLKSKEEAEEMVQETMLQLWVTREKLDERYPVSSYLYTIVKRLSLNRLKQIASSKSAAEHHFVNLKVTVNTTEDALSLSELKRITAEALALMPEKQQQVYRMSRNEGLSLDEIAFSLGILKNTVKKHLSEALKMIRIHFASRYYLLVVSLVSIINK